MRKGDTGRAGTSRDREFLLGAGAVARDLDVALDEGQLVRRKVVGQWLYASSAEALKAALGVVEAAAIERTHAWLIGATPYLRGPVAKASARPVVTFRAVELLVRELVHQGRLSALGLLTATYEPYLGLYVPDDSDEIAAQVEAMEETLRKRGLVRASDLPDPVRHREGKAWRWAILRHGEFRGLGSVAEGVLTAWKSDAS